VAWELIYTSAPRGLRAGTSGYCTVAQTAGLREDLAAALERRSLFAHEPKGESPVYFSFRNVTVGGGSWRVLTRALDAGLDFTGRRHFLAHHLVLDSGEELPGIQPADLLLGWKGWRDCWKGAPEELAKPSAEDSWKGVPSIRLPAREWKRVTGDAGWAIEPHRLASPVGWLAAHLSSAEMLRLMGESTAILEATQRGKSWLVPLEVGGPANPVAKESLWAGRVAWLNPAGPAGVRSVLRIEQCRGAVPAGRAEEIRLARTGEGAKAIQRKDPIVAVEPDRAVSKETEAKPGAVVARSWRRGLLVGMGLAVVGGGLTWWRLARTAELSTAPSAEAGSPEDGAAMVVPEIPTPPPKLPPAPVRVLAGPALAQSLWSEAGGGEPVAGLHLLFGKPSAPGVVEAEISLLLRDGADASTVRGPEGMVSLAAGEDRKKFCRDLSKRFGPWTLFVPDSRRGLAYLPDPFAGGGIRSLSAHGLSPGEILQDIGRSIFLSADRWSLLIRFPAWGEQQFMPVRVVGGEDNRVWLERLDQHRAQLRQMRLEALRGLTPWLKQDPSLWDEERIRKISRQIPSGPAAGVFEEFQRLDSEIRRWWQPPEAAVPAGMIFRRLLEHPGTVCELQLDELVIGRMVP